jgi:carbamoyl-phosphate synthase small subunit
MTAPEQGNYGTNAQDAESGRVHVSGFVVRELARRASSWRATGSLAEELARAGVVGLEGVDTRRLTLRLRDRGAMRCGLSTDDRALLERVRSRPRWRRRPRRTELQAQPARTSPDPTPELGSVYRVAAYDFG